MYVGIAYVALDVPYDVKYKYKYKYKYSSERVFRATRYIVASFSINMRVPGFLRTNRYEYSH